MGKATKTPFVLVCGHSLTITAWTYIVRHNFECIKLKQKTKKTFLYVLKFTNADFMVTNCHSGEEGRIVGGTQILNLLAHTYHDDVPAIGQ